MGPSMRIRRSNVTGIDGTSISVLSAEPASGARTDVPSVLAVHGFGSSAQFNWRVTGHLMALTRAGRRVLAPDLRGHGLSDRPHRPERYGFDLLIADLRSVLTEMGDPGGSVDVLGYSLGARLAWSLAADPDCRVRRLVLGGHDGRRPFDGVDVAELRAFLGWPPQQSPGRGDGLGSASRSESTVHPPATGSDRSPARRLAEMIAAAPGNDLVALAALAQGLPATVTDDPPPQMPTLVVAGSLDRLASGSQSLAQNLPDGRFLSVPGRDHVSTVPAGAFRRGVVEFLAG